MKKATLTVQLDVTVSDDADLGDLMLSFDPDAVEVVSCRTERHVGSVQGWKTTGVQPGHIMEYDDDPDQMRAGDHPAGERDGG